MKNQLTLTADFFLCFKSCIFLTELIKVSLSKMNVEKIKVENVVVNETNWAHHIRDKTINNLFFHRGFLVYIISR